MKNYINNIHSKIFLFVIMCVLTLCSGCEHKEKNNIFKAKEYNHFEKKEVADVNMELYDDYIFNNDGILCMKYTESDMNKSLLERLDYTVDDYYFVGNDDEIIENLKKSEAYGKQLLFKRDKNEYIGYDVIGNSIYIYDSDFNIVKEIQMCLDNSASIALSVTGFDKEYLYVSYSSFISNDEFINYLCIMDYDGNVKYQDEDLGFYIIQNEYKGCLLVDEEKNIYRYDEENGLIKQTGYDYFDVVDKIFPGDLNYDFYGIYYSEYGAYICGINENQYEAIICLDDYGYKDLGTQKSFYEFCNCYKNSAGEFFVCIRHNVQSDFLMLRFTPVDKKYEETEDSRIQLIILAEYYDDRFNGIVGSYNETSDKYKVVLKTFDELGDEYQTQKLFLNMIGNSEIDGIIQANYNPEMAKRGLLADLNDYFNSSEKVKKDMFFDNVVDSISDEDGAIYRIYTNYIIRGYVSKNIYKVKNALNYSDCLDSGKALFASADSFFAIGPFIYNSGSKYVDVDNKNVDVTELKLLLETIKKQKDLNLFSDKYDISDIEQVVNDYALFTYYDFFGPVAWLWLDECFDKEMSVTESSYDTASLVPGFINISIAESSNNKEGMYDFLDYIFSDEIYCKYYVDFYESENISCLNYLPVEKNAWQDILTYISSEEGYVDRFGKNKIFRGIYFDDNHLVESFSSDTIKRLNEFVNSAQYVKTMDDDIVDIIYQESEMYFDNKQDIEKTISNIEKNINNILRDK